MGISFDEASNNSRWLFIGIDYFSQVAAIILMPIDGAIVASPLEANPANESFDMASFTVKSDGI
jgi:hypothetical protein